MYVHICKLSVELIVKKIRHCKEKRKLSKSHYFQEGSLYILLSNDIFCNASIIKLECKPNIHIIIKHFK